MFFLKNAPKYKSTIQLAFTTIYYTMTQASPRIEIREDPLALSECFESTMANFSPEDSTCGV
jgi:hypothetical protein